jgi:hypothetical protein
MIKYFALLIFFLGFLGIAQETQEETQIFSAIVVNAQSDRPLESVHIVNLNKVFGTITNNKG